MRSSSPSPLIIIGSGLAGLLTAYLSAKNRPVVLITKSTLFDSNTQWSQGGIAAVLSPQDSVGLHSQDTLNAGHGLCDPEAVSVLAAQSRYAIELLVELGVQFDRDAQQQFILGLEAAHSVHRILHAGGDATGAEIQRVLVEQVVHQPNITVYEHTLVHQILVEGGRINGVHCFQTQKQQSLGLECGQVVLASGGAGQLYAHTSNPQEATGEGVMLAYDAGADLMDLEFYQFHPTALDITGAPNFLISEALRGEGALLRNAQGDTFMERYHPSKELAPRDVVSRAIYQEKAQHGTVYLDATHLDSEPLARRFPTILKTCLHYGLDIRKDLLPITPVAHYMIGGVVTDLLGRTSLKGLYACGEVSRTGVHGANRLASNSLLEATVFAIRVAQQIQEESSSFSNEGLISRLNLEIFPAVEMTRKELQEQMWTNVGIIRSQAGLESSLEFFQQATIKQAPFSRDAFEIYSMKRLGTLMIEAALRRQESRGAHFRSDFPTAHLTIPASRFQKKQNAFSSSEWV